MRLTVLAAAVLLAACTVMSGSAAAGQQTDVQPATINILAVGDSLTVGYGSTDVLGWRRGLGQLLTATGVTAHIDMYAVGGWRTGDVLPGLAAALLATHPDLVLLSIGTNDTGDIPGFEARYRQILAVILDMSPTTRIGVSFVAYSTPASLASGEAAVNDAIFRALYARGVFGPPPTPPRFAGVADFQVIPATYWVDGVHPGDAGYDVYARQWYRALAGGYGWTAISAAEPVPLTGHRP